MLFAFFLGAGNIIFPPVIGHLAGEEFLPALIGFLITAVGLPMLALLAMTRLRGSWKFLESALSRPLFLFFALSIILLIGPVLGVPRATLVGFEMGVRPFLGQGTDVYLLSFSVVFFVLGISISWSYNRLFNIVGKVLMPLAFCAILFLMYTVAVAPHHSLMAAQGEYVDNAFTAGLLDGYLTMDTFASLLFSSLLIDILKSRKAITPGFLPGSVGAIGAIVAVMMSVVYVLWFYLGATSYAVAPGVGTGGAILEFYLKALVGDAGQYLYSGIVLVACLTTVAGLMASCANFLAKYLPLSYRNWLVVIGLLCTLIVNIGLSQLIEWLVPVLVVLYPVAIALVILIFLRRWLPKPRRSFRIVFLVTFLFSVLDAARVSGFDVSVLDFMPLLNRGLVWLLLTAVCLAVVVCYGLPRSRAKA